MTTDRHIVDAHLILVRDERLLLSRRRDPNPVFDGRWHLPAGKVDAGESVAAAAIREAEEEIGVRIAPADLRLAHVLHAQGSGLEPRLGLFFEVLRWAGEPVNREPAKCSELAWFPMGAIPAGTIEYPAAGIRGYLDGRQFGLLGWS